VKGYQKWAGAMSSMADPEQWRVARKLLQHNGDFPPHAVGGATDSGSEGVVNVPRLIHGVLGLAGESGELAQHVLKAIFHGRDLSHVALTKELGDCYWYLNEIATALDVNFDDVIPVNVAKLEERYGSGKFTTAEEKAADRSDEAERKPITVASHAEAHPSWAQRIEKAAREMTIDEWLPYAKGVIPPSLLPSVGPHLTEFYLDWRGLDP
jgi:NTP pyrophosphatase (non-canonical NTP hydrolase)